MYRVNSKGFFNVPPAHRKSLNIYSQDNIKDVSKLLKKCTIVHGDFEAACKDAKKGDFVFFDSPYYNTFDAYQTGGFSKNEHKRLAKLFKKLTDKSVFCLLTNSNTDFIKTLYKDYTIEKISVKRMINSNGNNRTGIEVIVTNF